MERRRIAEGLVVVWLLGAVGCGTSAPAATDPGPLPHGGTGEFRPLEDWETGLTTTPAGRVLVTRAVAFDAVSVTPDGTLFYAASVGAATGPQDPSLPPGDVDFAVLPPRAIYRSPAREGNYGFEAGEVVLSMSETWEGPGVHSPWVVVLPDGRARLYYAADGGIGLAEAPSIAGAFTRVGAGPVLAPPAGATVRRPSVVPAIDGEGWLLYYESDGWIGVAESEDGVSFVPLATAIEVADLPIEEGDPQEIGISGPGAVTVITPVGRPIVRLYHESRRDDGSRFAVVGGTTDGVVFDRWQVPVTDGEDARDPAPRVIDARTTMLYWTVPREESDRQVRAIVAGVTPRTVELVLPPEAL